MEDKLTQIKNNNNEINNRIQNLIKKYDRNLPDTVVQRILQLEQSNIVATYLAEYDDFIFNKDINQKLGEVQISELCDSGLNHKTNSVILRNMQNSIDEIIGNDKSKFSENADISKVVDLPTYISYMQEKGGTALEFYLSTLPHEIRHMLGIDGNSAFPEAKGFAEGKNELDTRRAMQKYGIKYFPNRNYSTEVKFVECLENLVGKDVIDSLGSFKPLHYLELEEKYGDVFKQYVDLKDRNSSKKDANLYFESLGIHVSKKSPEFKSKQSELEQQYLDEDKKFKENCGLSNEQFKQMEDDYLNVNQSRLMAFQDMISHLPNELTEYVEQLLNQFDYIHSLDQNTMVKEYEKIDLQPLESFVNQHTLDKTSSQTTPDESKLQAILDIQEQELAELKNMEQPELTVMGNTKIMTIANINSIARNPEVAKKVSEARIINNNLSKEQELKKESNSMEL